MAVRAHALVDLDAIVHNVGVFVRAAAPSQVCVVVKADGYGHGAVAVAKEAIRGGAAWIAVVSAEEAAALRRAGVEVPILVMGALSLEELDQALAAKADVVAWTAEFLDAVQDRGGGRVHVKLDTGMGRLGTRDRDQATSLLRSATEHATVTCVGAMTHFATADARGDAFFGEQLARFTTWIESVRAEGLSVVAHAANSAATLRDAAAHFDLVRVGVGVYGLDPFGDDPRIQGLRPALTLKSRVAAIKPIAPGQSAGYGRRFIARTPGLVATIPIGYGDGWRRGLTNAAQVLIGGQRYPQVGTVSMDNITVDLGPHTDVAVDDEVVLIGCQGPKAILAETVAAALGTINYEITCGLLPRVPRVYVGGGPS